jgi:hypothetical protein
MKLLGFLFLLGLAYVFYRAIRYLTGEGIKLSNGEASFYDRLAQAIRELMAKR